MHELEAMTLPAVLVTFRAQSIHWTPGAQPPTLLCVWAVQKPVPAPVPMIASVVFPWHLVAGLN
jgi:hypothetical protein